MQISTHEIIFPRLTHSVRWRYHYLIFRKNVKKMRSASNQGLLYESIKYFVDAVTEKFSRHNFKLRPSESRVKNIRFTITKNRGYFIFKQVVEIFELLNKTVEIVYQYCIRRSIFFHRT